MNAVDIMRNGHRSVLEAVDGLAASHWQTPGVCGEWTVKDLIAHTFYGHKREHCAQIAAFLDRQEE